MDVIPDLFSLVAKNAVGPVFEIALDQIAKEPVQFDPTVVRPGQAAAPQGAGGHAEQVMAGLRRRMQNGLRPDFPEQRQNTEN
jgi:hypothetical protein